MIYLLVGLVFIAITKGELTDRKLASVLGELVDLRAELGDLFRHPTKEYDNNLNEEWVVHVDRGVAEAQWLANLTNTQFVGPVSNSFLCY
jgi:hypothetical protein